MKLLNDQRRLYLLSAVLLIVSVVLLFTWGLGGEGGETTPAPVTPNPTGATQTLIPILTPTPSTTAGATSSASAVRTVVYYQDNYGYLVPVMREIPEQKGVAKATLSLMVSSPQNDMEAARLGLRTVLPEDTSIELDIAGGVARVDLGKNVEELPDAAAESNMVSAVVQTLTEFPTVETVRFLVEGKEVGKLPHGTDISGDFARGFINIESSSAPDPEEASAVMLYFPGESGSMVVPVTRMVYGKADVNTAVLELVKGPSTQSPLDAILPGGCGLIGVEVDGGTVKINFTGEFIRLAEQSDGGRQALKALTLTCAQFPGIEKVEIYVEGEMYDLDAATLAVPTFVNEENAILDQYILTQASLLLEGEVD